MRGAVSDCGFCPSLLGRLGVRGRACAVSASFGGAAVIFFLSLLRRPSFFVSVSCSLCSVCESCCVLFCCCVLQGLPFLAVFAFVVRICLWGLSLFFMKKIAGGRRFCVDFLAKSEVWSSLKFAITTSILAGCDSLNFSVRRV